MSAVFLEKAFWGFLALVAALIAVIYRLFNGSLNKDLELRENKLELRLEKKFEDKLTREVKKLQDQMEALKRHETNNAKLQINLLRQLLAKLDKSHPDIFDDIIEND